MLKNIINFIKLLIFVSIPLLVISVFSQKTYAALPDTKISGKNYIEAEWSEDTNRWIYRDYHVKWEFEPHRQDLVDMQYGFLDIYMSEDGGVNWRDQRSNIWTDTEKQTSHIMVLAGLGCKYVRGEWSDFDNVYSKTSNTIEICLQSPNTSLIFPDVEENNIFKDHIEDLATKEIINGYSNGFYKPNFPVTRGALAKIMKNSIDFQTDLSCEDFPDVYPEHTFYEHIKTLKCNGIISGYRDGTFRPNEVVTRGQAMKFIVNAVRHKYHLKFPEYKAGEIFPDVTQNHTFYNYINSAASIELYSGERIINGYSNGNFGPEDPISREQIAKIINQTLVYIKDGGKISTPNPFTELALDNSRGIIIEELIPNIIGQYDIDLDRYNPDLIEPLDPPENFDIHYWFYSHFINLYPIDKKLITDVTFFSDGYYGVIAAVYREGEDLSKWGLAVDESDLYYKETSDVFVLDPMTAIHEIAHIYTLNSEEIDIYEASYDVGSIEEFISMNKQNKATCPNFYTLDGCSKPSSYLNQFYENFWEDKYAEFVAIEELKSLEEKVDAYADFISKYGDEYLTWYAITSPEEDLAESFAVFVLSDKPMENSTVVTDHKILFFYDYPELTEFRERTRSRIQTSYPGYLDLF
ncbi:hypothetical protein GF362_05935 [Candidatus Dojkabacteria bacterium]|nr:hypothetical protein [Candidatus Dojkabacteria bacterium]